MSVLVIVCVGLCAVVLELFVWLLVFVGVINIVAV